LESGIKRFSIPFDIDVASVPIDVQMEHWFLIVGERLPGGINKLPGRANPYAL